MLLAAGAMGYYNWRVFGNPLTLPYQINRATYAVSPVFIWGSPQPQPEYHHAVMRDFYVLRELPVFENARTLAGFFSHVAMKFGLLVNFFLGAPLVIPLLMLPLTIRDRRIRFLMLAGTFFTLGCLANAFSQPHYMAPATGLIYAVILQSMRHLRRWRPGGQTVGLFLVRATVPLCVVVGALQAAWCALAPAGDLPRTRVLRALESMPGRHLVVVRYNRGHDPRDEWVYNAANIDAAKVVWARDMGSVANQELLTYFKNRSIWAINADDSRPQLSRYAPSGVNGLFATYQLPRNSPAKIDSSHVERLQ
jgi:hypothetical protein